jgi:hypothetical protein
MSECPAGNIRREIKKRLFVNGEQDGLRASAVVSCSLLLYAGVLRTLEEATAMFTTRRCQSPQLQPSELRIVRYMASLANGRLPHMKPLVLRSLLVQPVPLFNKARDGCRPYVEIYSNGAMVRSFSVLPLSLDRPGNGLMHVWSLWSLHYSALSWPVIIKSMCPCYSWDAQRCAKHKIADLRH